MGKGTIHFDKLPSRRKIYGDAEFHIRPITNCYVGEDKNASVILVRIEKDVEGFFLEGEFGTGDYSLAAERKYARFGDYKNTKYVYIQEELDIASESQRKAILEWAIDGAWF